MDFFRMPVLHPALGGKIIQSHGFGVLGYWLEPEIARKLIRFPLMILL
jgi:hypothetical protein